MRHYRAHYDVIVKVLWPFLHTGNSYTGETASYIHHFILFLCYLAAGCLYRTPNVREVFQGDLPIMLVFPPPIDGIVARTGSLSGQGVAIFNRNLSVSY